MSAASLRPGDPAPEFSLRDVSLGYGGPAVVSAVTGSFAQGSLTAVVGPNGGGKTTLLKGLLGLVPAQAGTIESRHPRRALGHLEQLNEIDPGFPVTVEDFVSIGLWPRIGSLHAAASPWMQQVGEALRAVGLSGFEDCWIGQLSGGQFQRMRFARLLVQDSPVMLLDEPFAGVDEQTIEALLHLITAWHTQRKTVIAVLHDLDLVRTHFPQALAIAGRPLAWGSTATTLAALARARPRR